jgi:acetyl-CoA carboxylase biotin carboxyl carrier protein
MSEKHDEASELPAGGAASAPEAGGAALSEDAVSLLSLIDRLGALLERSELTELEVESGETAIILRKATAASSIAAAAGGAASSAESAGGTVAAAPVEAAPVAATKTVKAPLTGIFYGSSSPSSPPFVTVGQRVEMGQVIGLIEAMKLFNEIKSDQAGRVVRVVAESGKLVKAKQPLIEVEA